LKAAGFEFLNAEPKAGADNKMICFLHPKCTNGVLVELCMERV
jgi:methylmalonyl-CoA/ethylmalonyl-CoA epimerase